VRINNYVDQFVGAPGAVNADPTANGISTDKYAKFTFDFAVQGGVVGTIALTGAKLPANAIIMDGIVDVVTPLTGATATAAVQVEGANDTVTAAAISGAPWSTTGRKDVVEAGTAATSVKVTTAKVPSIVIGTANLTAGKFNVYLRYING